MALTKRQRTLVREIGEIAELFGLDYHNMEEYEPDARTPRLEATKRTLVRGQVVLFYTLVDELLSMEMCRYFFGRRRSFPQLWRTKRFQRFNHHIIEELNLMQKLRLVKAIRRLPKAVTADIERLNALRNGLAHAFFPENLKKVKPEWKGKSVFSVDGATALQDDCQKIFDFFLGISLGPGRGRTDAS